MAGGSSWEEEEGREQEGAERRKRAKRRREGEVSAVEGNWKGGWTNLAFSNRSACVAQYSERLEKTHMLKCCYFCTQLVSTSSGVAGLYC